MIPIMGDNTEQPLNVVGIKKEKFSSESFTIILYSQSKSEKFL